MKLFLGNLTTKLQISSNTSQLAIVVYNSINVSQHFALNSYVTSAELQTAIDGLTFDRIGDNTTDILK